MGTTLLIAEFIIWIFKTLYCVDNIKAESIAEVLENGSLLVYGNITVKDKNGHEDHKNKVTAFCRCGQSSNKPYCDGTYVKVGFKA